MSTSGDFFVNSDDNGQTDYFAPGTCARGNNRTCGSVHSFTSEVIVCIFSNATALTVQNIVQELRGVDLLEEKNGKNILGIPSTKLTELKSAHRSTDEQQAAIVRYWLLRDSFASWRQIIFQLDTWAGYISYGHFSNRADRIRHYAEELTGMCFFRKTPNYPCLTVVA